MNHNVEVLTIGWALAVLLSSLSFLIASRCKNPVNIYILLFGVGAGFHLAFSVAAFFLTDSWSLRFWPFVLGAYYLYMMWRLIRMTRRKRKARGSFGYKAKAARDRLLKAAPKPPRNPRPIANPS